MLGKISSAHILNANKEGELQKGRSVILKLAKGYQLGAQRPFEPFYEKKKVIGNWEAQ